MSNPVPDPGRFFADVLWNTDLLPPYIIGPTDNVLYVKKTVAQGLAASVNGIDWNSPNPLIESTMISGINNLISSYAYGSLDGGYNCLNNVYGDGRAAAGGKPAAPIITANNIPCRYVVLGGTGVLPSGISVQQADQLQVSAPGAGGTTFLQTDWRSAPDYLPGNTSGA